MKISLTIRALAALTLCVAAHGQSPLADSAPYRNPIVFCRSHIDEATGKFLRNSKLWVMEEDGSRLQQLTFDTQYDDHPSFYSDQRRVLYSEFGGPKFDRSIEAKLISLDIYTGERKVVLEEDGKALHHASLSPLGDELLIYHKDTSERRSEWFLLPPNTYEINALASNGVAASADSVIFMHEKNRGAAPRGVSLARIYGHGPGAKIVMLTDEDHLHRRPAVSPDGKWLAWQSNAEGGEDEILLSGMDARNPKNMTRTPGNDGHPWFSRDGQWIIFESDRTADIKGNGCDSRRGCEIWKLNIETGEQVQLTSGGKQFASNRPRM